MAFYQDGIRDFFSRLCFDQHWNKPFVSQKGLTVTGVFGVCSNAWLENRSAFTMASVNQWLCGGFRAGGVAMMGWLGSAALCSPGQETKLPSYCVKYVGSNDEIIPLSYIRNNPNV